MFFKALSMFLQFLIDAIGAVLGFLVGLLPGSPFTFVSGSQFGEFLSKINFFIPIYEFVSILEAWLVAVAVYYLYSVYARWVKAIE